MLKKLFVYILFPISIFIFLFTSPKSHAYSNDDFIVSYYYDGDNHLLSYVDILNTHNSLIDNYSVSHFDSSSSGYHTIKILDEESYHNDTAFYYDTSRGYRRFKNYENNYYTISDCKNAGYGILKIPSGFNYEGQYICVPTDLGGEVIEEEPIIMTPEAFDEFYCGNSNVVNEINYTYFTYDKITDYSVRKSLTSSQIENGSDSLNIYICGVDTPCTYESFIDRARDHLANVPEERIFVKQDSLGNYYDYEIFAYCETTPVKLSAESILPETDCRKVLYQITGSTGVNLTPLPEEVCYTNDNYEHTFKEWCQKSFPNGTYTTDGFNEVCNNEGVSKVTENPDGSKEIDEIDVNYETDETRDDITKEITEGTTTIDSDGNVQACIANCGDTTTTITIDKGIINTIGGDGEGTGSGIGEGENVGSYGEVSSFYESKYPDGLVGILENHFNDMQGDNFNNIFNELNPFQDNSYTIPVYDINLNFGDGYNYGIYEIDLHNMFGYDLIKLIRAMILLMTGIICIRIIIE